MKEKGGNSLWPLSCLWLARILRPSPEPSLALTLSLSLLPERQRVSPRCWGVGGAESCASPIPSPALAAPPPPSEGRGLRRQSWLGLDAISAAEQGSLAGSNFLIRTPGLPACWFSALTPLLQNRTPQASLQTTHTHREPHVYKSEGLQWGHCSGTGCRRGIGAKPPAAETQVKVKVPHSAPRRLFQASAPSLPATDRVDPQPHDREGRLG